MKARPAVLKLALPGGDLRGPVADLLVQSSLTVAGYREGSRAYRLQLADSVLVRVFREKDIPIQVALGNYDLGICNLAWVEELMARYPREAIVKMRNLELGISRLVMAAAQGSLASLSEAAATRGLRIASEYPSLAEAFALAARIPSYRILPVWGAAEAYPPEDADLTLIAVENEDSLRHQSLQPLHQLLEGSAWLIANRQSLREKDLSPLLEPLMAVGPGSIDGSFLDLPSFPPTTRYAGQEVVTSSRDVVRVALPDGHLQGPAAKALAARGLTFAGYDQRGSVRRPLSPMAGLEAKVIRPHDMPQLVALGSFDLAISGRDCLRDHLYRFPSSPVREVADLDVGGFDLSAVVSKDLPAGNLDEALAYWRSQGRPVLRLASEFVNIADHYARNNHFWRYQVIPTAGASEGFVPDDADLLIEGTETGETLARNNLKPIDLLFRSTICLLANKGKSPEGPRGEIQRSIVAALGGS